MDPYFPSSLIPLPQRGRGIRDEGVIRIISRVNNTGGCSIMILSILIFPTQPHQFLPMILYIGPDQFLPLASALGAILGVLLMWWHRLTDLIRKTWQFFTKKR